MKPRQLFGVFALALPLSGCWLWQQEVVYSAGNASVTVDGRVVEFPALLEPATVENGPGLQATWQVDGWRLEVYGISHDDVTAGPATFSLSDEASNRFVVGQAPRCDFVLGDATETVLVGRFSCDELEWAVRASEGPPTNSGDAVGSIEVDFELSR